MKHYVVGTAILTAIAGCASTPPAPENSSRGAPAAASSSAQAPRAAAATPAPSASAKTANSTAGGAPTKLSVYFDYDSNVVKDEFTPVVQSNARYVAQQRGARVTIAGNTDDRGSREYNLALGQRRADAVKQRMTLLGVPAPQIETVSFGEEKPRGTADEEQAHAENRRADIVYAK